MISILVIGDMHFKQNNEYQTNQLTEEIKKVLSMKKYDYCIILGDSLDTFSRIDMDPYCRCVRLFNEIISLVDKKLIWIKGNHECYNNSDFLDPDHPFLSFSNNDKVLLCSKPEILVLKEKYLVFIPYVYPGRFTEALNLLQKDWLEKTLLVFAHQEFYGCKMGVCNSEIGDKYPSDYPLCISGHIHDFHELGENIIYIGTPYQTSFSDVSEKRIFDISITEEENFIIEEIFLNVQKKLTIKMNLDELINYTPPPNTHVKILLSTPLSSISKIDNIPNVKKLKLNPFIKIKIVYIKEDEEKKEINLKLISSSFKERLYNEIEKYPKEIKDIFNEMK